MPEGDSLHRAAQRLQVLVGERIEAETPHPRAAATGVAPHLDGRRLIAVEAVGKNLLLRFDGGVVLRSHLRMRGRWQVRRRGESRGTPWLVLRGTEQEAVLWNGPVLELGTQAVTGLGPDILGEPLQLDRMIANLRREAPGREIGDALLDQRLVAGIGNLWRAEALWQERISPWARLGDLDDSQLGSLLTAAAVLMRRSLAGGRDRRAVYRRHVCPRCRTGIRARGQGDGNRTAYWCPACQGEGRSP